MNSKKNKGYPEEKGCAVGNRPGGKSPLGLEVLQLWGQAGRPIRLTAHGHSMHPFIRTGDVLTLHLVEASSLRIGDIFAFWTDHGLVTHRLIKRKRIDGQWWLCQKGDHCPGWGWIHSREVLGKVVVIQGRKIIEITKWPWLGLNLGLGLLSQWWVNLLEAGHNLKLAFFMRPKLNK